MSSNAHVLVINGPNLNLLGRREPEVYGSQTLADIVDALEIEAQQHGVRLSHVQSNSEAELIDTIHQTDASFIVINPAALTHTSVALRDALLGVAIPFIEIHLSNVHAREPFRHHSYLSDVAVGVICGLGSEGYSYALASACRYLKNIELQD
ncbi:type II 3-dehydroquinate dehydratase [Ferrimonas lipolytica]|uniref:3-dehydroquinate dehydratase n=1 Tax=Ferrimonas lipolytica TaxID=2724191 RepID=A0A6H1ULD8_9GAMM|nr:type II 3-dehydroquinate dehydratase [Ferrimonas lipolytica]QIZ78612.1 type II 3-dehydroquinate dehydratase [Ferrimonas lipolytica]